MKNLLKLCIMLLMLVGFGVGHATTAKTLHVTTYTVVEGDILSAIVKKFPGTTLQTLAKTNDIANPDLIWANTILKIPQSHTVNSRKSASKEINVAKVKLSSLQHPISAVHGKSGPTCDAKHGLDQLGYPNTVRATFESERPRQNGQAVFESERLYFVNQGGNQYVFQVSKHCVFTKFVRVNGSRVTNTEPSDRGVAGVSTEIDAIPPPESTPRESLGAQFSRIKEAIEEVLGPPVDGPPQDVTPLAMALLKHRQLIKGTITTPDQNKQF
jgi:LysM repeat protein